MPKEKKIGIAGSDKQTVADEVGRTDGAAVSDGVGRTDEATDVDEFSIGKY